VKKRFSYTVISLMIGILLSTVFAESSLRLLRHELT